MNKTFEQICILLMAIAGLFVSDSTLIYMIFGVLAMIYSEMLGRGE